MCETILEICESGTLVTPSLESFPKLEGIRNVSILEKYDSDSRAP